jgi:hypothetical protein
MIEMGVRAELKQDVSYYRRTYPNGKKAYTLHCGTRVTVHQPVDLTGNWQCETPAVEGGFLTINECYLQRVE